MTRDAVLCTDEQVRLSPKKFGEWYARQVGRDTPFASQTIRNKIREGLPHVRTPTDQLIITDLEAAEAWCRANWAESVHGGKREGAGRRPERASGDPESVDGVCAFDDSPTGKETVGGNGFQGAAAETPLGAQRREKLKYEVEMLELKLARERGELVPRTEAAEGAARVAQMFVRALSRLPAVVADRLADQLGLASEERSLVERIVREETDRARDEIARDPLGLESDDERARHDQQEHAA